MKVKTLIFILIVIAIIGMIFCSNENKRAYGDGHCVIDGSKYDYMGKTTDNDAITWYRYDCQCGHTIRLDERMD